MANKGVVPPLILLAGLIIKIVWLPRQIPTGIDEKPVTTYDHEMGLNYTCNQTLVLGPRCQGRLDFWFRYFIWRNLHTCRRDCFCYNLFVDNSNGNLCKKEGGQALDLVKDLVVNCTCREPKLLI